MQLNIYMEKIISIVHIWSVKPFLSTILSSHFFLLVNQREFLISCTCKMYLAHKFLWVYKFSFYYKNYLLSVAATKIFWWLFFKFMSYWNMGVYLSRFYSWSWLWLYFQKWRTNTRLSYWLIVYSNYILTAFVFSSNQ